MERVKHPTAAVSISLCREERQGFQSSHGDQSPLVASIIRRGAEKVRRKGLGAFLQYRSNNVVSTVTSALPCAAVQWALLIPMSLGHRSGWACVDLGHAVLG